MQSYWCPSGATEARKGTLVVLQLRKKAACKSRPGHLVSSAWCLWIVHECGFRLQAKNGFQYLCQYGRFSKIQSQLYKWYASQVSSQIQGCEGPQLVNSSFTIVTPLGATWDDKTIWLSSATSWNYKKWVSKSGIIVDDTTYITCFTFPSFIIYNHCMYVRMYRSCLYSYWQFQHLCWFIMIRIV